MAEESIRKNVRTTGDAEETKTGRWTEMALVVGKSLLTHFLIGAAMAAGGQAFSAVTRRMGGGSSGELIPIRKVS